MITSTEARAELRRLRSSGLLALLEKHAKAHGLPLPYVVAIASRETNARNILGDGGHGVGLMQIDIQHPIALHARDSGSWRTQPEPLIEFGCALLAANYRRAATAFPHADAWAWLKIGASAYNTGIERAIEDSRRGDSDLRTTQRDYGHDVMGRVPVFAALLETS